MNILFKNCLTVCFDEIKRSNSFSLYQLNILNALNEIIPMKHICLLLLVICLSACSDTEERYLGNWDADYIEINQIEPLFCSSSWAEIFKLNDGNMRVEVKICDEEFFATTNNYNYDVVEFGFVDQPTFDVEIVVEGTFEYIGGGQLELNMIRDIYVDGFLVSGKEYYAVFD